MTYNKALSAHYRRLETDPMYRMLEAMEDFRVDMIPGRGTDEEIVEPDIPEPQWNKRQWGIVDQLRLNQINLRNTLYSTLKENKAKYASKGKSIYKEYTNE